MQFIDADATARALPYDRLVERLREMYRNDRMTARRELISLESLHGDPGACMAVMPAFGPGHDISTKIFTLLPQNAGRGLATVHAVIAVFDGETGVPKAVVDGTEVTRRRTAAMCALAADYLARRNSERLVVCGAGALAPHAALAHASIRPIRQIGIWARRPEAAAAVVETVAAERGDIVVEAVADLPQACREADIVSCQTSASEPVVSGEWIRPGTHMDFVGSHDADKRECDDEAVRRSYIYVDVMESALREAGDILIPMKAGVIGREDIRGDLSDLCRETVPGRFADDQVTLYKSTGSSLADLAGAELAVEFAEARPAPSS